MDQTSLPPEILHLSISQRVELVEQIWNSIADDEKQFPLTDPQKAELDARLAAQQADPERGSPWSDVKKRLGGD
jgi:putative addiction module component (TIGR02574 family)